MHCTVSRKGCCVSDCEPLSIRTRLRPPSGQTRSCWPIGGPLGESPISRLRRSKIPVPERPPDQYPQEVWDELARQKRLIAASDGTYELPPE